MEFISVEWSEVEQKTQIEWGKACHVTIPVDDKVHETKQ